MKSSTVMFRHLVLLFFFLSACDGPSGDSDDAGDVGDLASGGDLSVMPSRDGGLQEDLGPVDADTASDGCNRFCSDSNRSVLSQCLNEGEAITLSSCLSFCETEGHSAAGPCLESAGRDCSAAEVCLIKPVAFEVRGTDALMRGAIDGRALQAVAELLERNPEVNRIIMVDVPGSLDDTANLQASRMIRAAGLDTHVPANGKIASGGVDFFCAGTARTAQIAEGAQLGVHSWGHEDGFRGDRLPMDHPEHQPYLDYYQAMGIPADFYWFTLQAASPDDIHWMSEAEAQRYMLTTP